VTMRIRIAFIFPAMAAMLVVLGGVALSSFMPQSATAKGNGADWPRYTGDLAGTRFSTLKQINAQNVQTLTSAFTVTGVGSQETPIVVNGVMYVSTPGGVLAIEADTGKKCGDTAPYLCLEAAAEVHVAPRRYPLRLLLPQRQRLERRQLAVWPTGPAMAQSRRASSSWRDEGLPP